MPRSSAPRCIAAAVLGVAVLVSGCSEEAKPLPPQQVSEPTPTATVGPGNWRVKFSKAELAAYSTAVGRWRDYGRRSEKYYRPGPATQGSPEMVQDYFSQPAGMQDPPRNNQKKTNPVI